MNSSLVYAHYFKEKKEARVLFPKETKLVKADDYSF